MNTAFSLPGRLYSNLSPYPTPRFLIFKHSVHSIPLNTCMLSLYMLYICLPNIYFPWTLQMHPKFPWRNMGAVNPCICSVNRSLRSNSCSGYFRDGQITHSENTRLNSRTLRIIREGEFHFCVFWMWALNLKIPEAFITKEIASLGRKCWQSKCKQGESGTQLRGKPWYPRSHYTETQCCFWTF